MPGDVVAGAGGHDAQRHIRHGDDVHAQVHHAVTADDDQRLDVLVWSVSQKSTASTTRLLIRAAAHVEHLVPGFAQEPAGDVVGSRMTAASGGGIGQQGYTHEGTDAKVRKNG